MSYILKALKRAQESRRIDGSTVTAAVQRLRAVDRPQRLPWRWIALGVLALNAAAIALLIIWPHLSAQSPHQDEGSVPAPPPAPVIATPAPAPTMAVAPTPSVPTPPTAAVTPPAAAPALPVTTPAQPTPAPTPSAPPVRPPAAVAPLPAPSSPAPAARLKAPESARPATAPSRKLERAALEPADRPEAAAPPSPAPAAPAPASTPPTVMEDSPELREVLSKFKIEVLVWAADPKERMVFLNGRKYVEGQTLDGKVVVELIAEDGIILAYQGQRVRVKRP